MPAVRLTLRRAGPAGVAVLAACAAVRAAPPPAAGVLPPLAHAGEYAQVDAARAFAFPADHGPHPGFRQEWWYVTGNLDGPQGERLGFELTFFRFDLAPAPPAADPASAWRAHELVLAHFAVTDVARGHFQAAQKLSRAALGLAGAQGAPLKVWIDDWSLAQTPGADGTWTLHAAQPGYAIELTLDPVLPPVLNGDAGLSRKSGAPGSASYYYSVPRLAVRGSVRRAGATLPVHGSAWLDREWGSGALGQDQAGWDWFALQLDDGSTLMFYALRRRDGTRDAYSAGTWCDAAGRVRALRSEEVTIEATGTWRNGRGDAYPARWRLRVPALALDVTVRPVLADQELDTRPRYWEGAVDVSGNRAGAPVGGRGYVELVGYARER